MDTEAVDQLSDDLGQVEDTHTTATRLAQLAQLSESTRYGADSVVPPFNIDPAITNAAPPTDIAEMLAKIVQQNQQLAEAVRTSKRDHDKMERELREEIRSLKESVKVTSTEIIEPRNKKAKIKVAVSNKCKVIRPITQ